MPRTLPEGRQPLTTAQRQARFKRRQTEQLAFARAAYHDPKYSPARCLHCGNDYTGPSVYCSLECAMIDAK